MMLAVVSSSGADSDADGRGLRGAAPRALGEGIALVMKPSFATGKPASLVMISGAAIANTAYQPMLQKLQDASAQLGISLWVGSPWYLGSTPNPADLKQRVQDVQQRLSEAGLPAGAKAFFAAHSLGTVFLQDFVKGLGLDGAAGQILMGGFLARKHLTPELSFPVPTLTLGAELDGLARITRIAESVFHQEEGKSFFPVVVLPGQNHMQFASGSPPLNVRRNDLAAEVSEAVAHEAIASASADFLAQCLGLGSSAAERRMAERASATQALLAPVLQAYALEGSRRFGVEAQYGGSAEKSCVRGLCPSQSPWAPEAQRLISGPALEKAAPSMALEVTNAFVKLGGSPVTGQDFHLPNLTRAEKKVTISTYSQCYWNDVLDEVLEDFDTGFTFTSAQEIGTKLLSRQCTLTLGLGEKADFSQDDPDFCAATNQKALDWALKHVPAASAKRFQSKGVQLVMGKDLQKQGGPLWLYARLELNKKEQDGRQVVEVVSPAQKTEQDYWKDHFHVPRPSAVPDPGCYHYCKLLSPARALEWIMVDGLRTATSGALEEAFTI